MPVVLAIGGVAFAFMQDSRQQDLEHRRAQADAVQAYLDQMSTLLIVEAPKTVIEEGDEKKRRPLQDPTAITVARARTLTILGRVASDRRRPTDQERKRTVLQFLYEARLIQRDSRGRASGRQSGTVQPGDHGHAPRQPQRRQPQRRPRDSHSNRRHHDFLSYSEAFRYAVNPYK